MKKQKIYYFVHNLYIILTKCEKFVYNFVLRNGKTVSIIFSNTKYFLKDNIQINCSLAVVMKRHLRNGLILKYFAHKKVKCA